MNTILAFPFCYHDHNFYNGEYHHQEERFTRIKHNITDDKSVKDAGISFSNKYLDEDKYDVIATNATSQFYDNFKNEKYNKFMREMLKTFRPKNLWDYSRYDKLYYIDHHQAHAAYAFLMSGFEESDILAIDGSGRCFKTIFIDKSGRIYDLSKDLAIGKLWELVARCSVLGRFGEGKLMGLSAYGESDKNVYRNLMNIMKDRDLNNFEKISKRYFKKQLGIEECKIYASTLQELTIEQVTKKIKPLKSCDNLCVTGGVAYNGYLNEHLLSFYDDVYVPPAAGDEGQSLGLYMHADYILNDRIEPISVYSGLSPKLFNEETMIQCGFIKMMENDIVELIAEELSNGKIIGWYHGRSESGQRALGNRSILADPRIPDIKDRINKTIKKREDFRPFAPSVLEEHYKEFFDTKILSPYMNRIVKVISDKIPGVVHVDNTARIQTVNKNQNPLFYKLIEKFYKITGIPMILNTSFNLHEPIVETVEDALKTFEKTGLDILVVEDWVIGKNYDL